MQKFRVRYAVLKKMSSVVRVKRVAIDGTLLSGSMPVTSSVSTLTVLSTLILLLLDRNFVQLQGVTLSDSTNTTALIPVYMPTKPGESRVMVGKASVDENGMAMIVIDNRTDGKYLSQLVKDGLLVSVSFEVKEARSVLEFNGETFPEIVNVWGHSQTANRRVAEGDI
jgi:hypothetical protein